MFIDTIPNRKSPPAVLLRESYREGGRVKKRTLANLSKLPQALIAGIAALLDGGKVSGKRAAEPGFEIVRSLPHGHVAAVQAMRSASSGSNECCRAALASTSACAI